MGSFLSAASRSISVRIPPQVALYPPAKKPNVREKIISSAMLPCDVKPQKRNADSADASAEMDVTAVAERGKCLLSLR